MSWKLLFFILPLAASASQTELEAIEVGASKDIERFTFTISEKIPQSELEAQALGIVSPLLEKVPGLVASQNGGPGGRISFFLRGTESRHVSFTLDGLKINDTSNTDRQFDAAFLTAPFIKEMNIYKGPQAVLYGSDALGGLVEMKTRKGDHAPETKLTLSGGSFGTIGSTLSKDWGSKKSNGSLTATRFHSDGISRVNKKRFSATEKDATDITQVTFSSEHRLTPKLQIDLLATYLHGKAEQDPYNSDNSHDYSRNDHYILQQKTTFELAETSVLSLRNGFNRHQRLSDSLTSNEEFFNGDLFQHELLHRLEKGPFAILTGLSTEHETVKAINLDRSFDLHSGFLTGSLSLGQMRFHAGGRADKHSRYGTFFTGSGGIAFQELSIQYSQGFKAPSLYQLYGPDSFGSPVGNPDLRPETNHYTEFSWKKKTDTFESGLSLFQNRLSNLFTYVFGKGYLNQQRFIVEGLEISGKFKRELYEIRTSFTHQQFKEKETSVLRRPYNIVHAGISFFPVESIELNLNGRWYSARKDFDAKLNSFEVLDAGIRKNWGQNDLNLEIRNICNREYEELYGFSVLTRSIFMNYSHRFQ
jgi:vitamin B12 transporter